MNIDWAHFTPYASLTGGIILGIASAIFILVNGRILGISGIVGGLFPPKLGDTFWRVAFFARLVCRTHSISCSGACRLHHRAAH